MGQNFLVEDDYTNLAIEIEASDPKALMALWERPPAGTRLSQPLTRAFGGADLNAILVMATNGVLLTTAILSLVKALRDIKQSNPGLSLRLRVRCGSKVTETDLGLIKTTEWEVVFEYKSDEKFVGDENLAAAARLHDAASDSEDE